jgi:hypothetical protein
LLWASSALALLVAMFAAAASSWPAALGAVAIAVLPLSKRTSQLRAARLAALLPGGLPRLPQRFTHAWG